MRAGLRAADVLTTVSPTYAGEIRTPEFGMGLEDVLNDRAADLVGILNGVDYDVWSPNSDPFIDTHYNATNVSPKYRIKGALEQRVGLLPDQNAPLLGVVSRLAPQKGIDLVASVLPTLVAATRANFVFLGNGDATLAAELRRLATAHPRRIAFTDGYDEQLAHQIFAGSDIALVPSRYEPCGLTQMYALRYGTIPVVRATGGLADTIQHFDPAAGTRQRQRVPRRGQPRVSLGRALRARLVRRPDRLVPAHRERDGGRLLVAQAGAAVRGRVPRSSRNDASALSSRARSPRCTSPAAT